MTIWRLIRLASILLLAGTAQTQSHPIRLTSNQRVELRGKLTVRTRGYLSYLLIETEKPYLADGGDDEGVKSVRLVEIRSNGNYAQLAKHAGEMVTARGSLFIEFAAPAQYNGVQLEDAVVTFPNGQTLRPQPDIAPVKDSKLPPTVHRYLMTKTMMPGAAKKLLDRVVDLDTGTTLTHENPGYCVMSGAQDFMTCACEDGFVPVRGGLVKQPYSFERWRYIPQPENVWKEMRAVQFQIPEENPAKPVHIQLVCERSR